MRVCLSLKLLKSESVCVEILSNQVIISKDTVYDLITKMNENEWDSYRGIVSRSLF